MQWSSWSAFFNMGGYAFYVWCAFGLTLFCMVWEVMALRKRSAEAIKLAKLLAQG